MDSTQQARVINFGVDENGKSFWGGASAPASAATFSAGPQPIEEQVNRNDAVPTKTIAAMSYGQRVRIARIWQSHTELLGTTIRVAGWAKKGAMDKKDIAFIEINDGSCFRSIQAVISKGVPGFEQAAKANAGASLMIKGRLIESPKAAQPFELAVDDIQNHHAEVLGATDGTYPIAGRPSMETLRKNAHLRNRTNTFGAVCRVKNNLAFATHTFFNTRGFLYIHTPLITASDCEGAGEMFQVTTVLPEGSAPVSKAKLQTHNKVAKPEAEVKAIMDAKAKAKADAEAAKAAAAEAAGKKPKKDKKDKKKKGDDEDKPTEEDLYNFEPVPLSEQKVDYKQDMFGRPAFLSVSGQLNVETAAVGLADCYTFGPTFRAENSHTTRHLCEFWMIEPELAFATLRDDMDCAEDYLKFCLKYVLENNKDDLQFFDERVEKGLIARLQKVVSTPFERVDYTEAVRILEEHIKGKKVKFEFNVSWGVDLASEHEKYLTDVVFKGPIIVYNYPKDIKAFYMKLNDDNKTVQAMDVLVPKIGEVIGGSAREDRLDVLDRRIEEMSLDQEAYWWYRDLRKYGGVPHAGFGLGFERLVMMATGMENIKDCIPFPRSPGQAEF